jgi:TonB family protein
MKTILLFTVGIFFTSTTSFSQAEKLYNLNRKLIADTSITISQTAYQILKESGKNPLRILQRNLKYPEIAKENYVKGSVIASFEVTRKGELINIIIEKSTDENFSKSVIEAINNSKTSLGGYLKPKQDIERFYIPFKFDLDVYDFNNDINTNSALTKKEIVTPFL